MTRLNISFNAHVPTLHPSILMTLLSLLSVLRLFGISVTLAPPTLTDLDPTHLLTTLSPNISDEAKRVLSLATPDPNQLIANLAPALSTDARTALDHAKINPANAIAGLAPVLTDEANRVLNQAHINPTEAVANLAPADLTKAFHDATADHASTVLASPFQAAADHLVVADGLPEPVKAEALNALAHATTESISFNTPLKANPEQISDAQPGKVATAMHNDISAQVSRGDLSKEGALAAHAALYNVLSAKIS